MRPPLTLHVVSHTHWDREWYHTAERFRQRLVALVDELLDEPPAAGESFLLDGQGVVLDDYLAVRPERAAELSALLRDGRIEAGPWYVLPDELIPGAESLVRNLLAGRDAVRASRGEPPPVLYCPDSFGHPAILPDLARGFGCELVVAWRGYGGARWPAGDTVRWRGAGGAEVLLHHLPPDGYEFGGSLPNDPSAARERWERISSIMGPRATTGVALLLNGADHHARQRDQAAAVVALAAAAAPATVRPGSLRGAAEALGRAARDVELPMVQGELRDSYGYTWTLQGTLSARAQQKRRAAEAERLLVRDVEPWIALDPRGAAAGTRALLRTAWKELLLTHPHDTLCGTSIDAVARAFEHRIDRVMVQGFGLRDDAIIALIDHDREAARADATAWRPAVVLRNPAPRVRSGVAELTLTATLADVAVGPGSATRQGARRAVEPLAVEGMPLQLLDSAERVELTESPRAYPDADLVLETRALGWVSEIGGYQVASKLQRAGSPLPSVPHPVRGTGLTLDNGLLCVEVSPAGRVLLTDVATGRAIADLLSLQDQREVGDLYTPAPREQLPDSEPARVARTLDGPLRGEITIEWHLRSGTLTLRLQLDAAAAFLRVRVDGDNRQGAHRLRLRVATGVRDGVTLADAAFHPAVRIVPQLSADEQRMEHVVRTAPLHRWVSRYGDRAGMTLFSDGLAEYECLPDGALAVTLLRAVDQLSRADLPERPGHVGWPADVPDARCIGPYAASFAVSLAGARTDDERDAIERMADDVLLPITGETLRSSLAPARVAGGLTLDGAGLAFSAALPARQHGWVALRCVNRRDEMVRGQWRLATPVAEAVRARLDETPLDPSDVTIAGDTISFEAAPREIVTILVRR